MGLPIDLESRESKAVCEGVGLSSYLKRFGNGESGFVGPTVAGPGDGEKGPSPLAGAEVGRGNFLFKVESCDCALVSCCGT